MSQPRIRCAIYTRKSHEDGLEQDFNSLDAQREACEAYIASQKSQGWIALKDRFDDGGVSGGTLERPALVQLLALIDEGRIDVVVIYKIDRLTRSLADFARLVERFEKQNVSFVAVTQQFNTANSMGRLTLNVLLSFAQFEREVTAERIRDKIASSKAKGMWMGGMPPLGYAVKDRALVIEPSEAETVRTLFRLMVEHGTARAVTREARRLGLTTRRWTDRHGRAQGGNSMMGGPLYHLLKNPIYVGRVPHKGQTHPGRHPAIIDQETWDRVQALFAANRSARTRGSTKVQPSPFIGKLFDETGDRLTPTYSTTKTGRRHHYYISQRLVREDRKDGSGWRLPARPLMQLLAQTVTEHMSNPAALFEAIGGSAETTPKDIAFARDVLARLSSALDSANADHSALLDELIERVDLQPRQLSIQLNRRELLRRIGLRGDEAGEPITITKPIVLRRRGVETKLVVSSSAPQRDEPDPVLLRGLARAHTWWRELRDGATVSVRAIAKRERLPERYVAWHIELAFLAPDIVEAILEGRQPADLTLDWLLRSKRPLTWPEQRAEWGFPTSTTARATGSKP